MHVKFIDKEICYTGEELSSHWIYTNFNLLGDAIVAFEGECIVKLDNMVDLADVLSESPIYSKKMVHVIVEHFNISLIEGILRQRLLINIARDVIGSAKKDDIKIIRDGDDLFYNDGKLSVSIATKSPTSVLIHLGLNIISEGAPVKAAGLKSDMNIEDTKTIASDIIKYYALEHEEIIKASCKVRGVM
ncbi:MAG: DUF366 family protein [bacterium]